MKTPTCRFCHAAVLGNADVHDLCCGRLPGAEDEYPTAAAAHITRLLARRDPRSGRRRGWCIPELILHTRDELQPHVVAGAGLALAAGAIRYRHNKLELAPERPTSQARRMTDERALYTKTEIRALLKKPAPRPSDAGLCGCTDPRIGEPISLG
jgi:hypothetical protein